MPTNHDVTIVQCLFPAYKTTTILLDGKRVKLQLWDTSGQGRFCTIIRSYSRGAQGILLVYDITNKWSFDSIDRWLEEVEKVCLNWFSNYNHELKELDSIEIIDHQSSLFKGKLFHSYHRIAVPWLPCNLETNIKQGSIVRSRRRKNFVHWPVISVFVTPA